MPPLVLPPTSAYPRAPTALERERLDALYLELRGKYKSLMISRGIHRSRSQKQGGLLRELSQRLRALAMREASVKAEAYAMLEIVTDVVEHLEDAGDEMGTAFGAYQLGRHSYNGGGNIGRLVQAVINFLNRWRTGKEHFEQLSARQEALRANLRELDGGMPLMVQTEPRVAGELAEGLERLGVKKLKPLCKERGFKGYTGLTKAALIQRLRGGGEAPLAAKAPAKAEAIPSGLPAIETRLDRMEALLQRIAQRVGLSDAGTEVHGHSADAEHRAILAAALLSPPRRNLAELLRSIGCKT